MRHKSTTKKRTSKDFVVAQYWSNNSIWDKFADEILETRHYEDEPGNFFRCKKCDKILEYEYFPEDVYWKQEVCMECADMVFCCHHQDDDPTADAVAMDSDERCDDSRFPYHASAPCTCEKKQTRVPSADELYRRRIRRAMRARK